MTDIFTASNGVEVEIKPNEFGRDHMRQIEINGGKPGHLFKVAYHEDQVQALREYFQAERDTELGRWRDPEAPDVVVYHLPSAKREATGRTVRVLDERLGATVICNEHLERSSDPTNAEPTANRYFAAHPEPKPWESAEEGEMWLITCGTGYKNAPAIVKDGNFYFPNRYGDGMDFIDLEGVMTATRIWPEETDDE